MNRPVTLLLAIAACAAAALAQTPAEIFREGNELYRQGKPAEAARAYESILSNGYVSGELYYNLGNAHYRLGDLGRAILNYERALRLMPGDDDLRHNLQLATSKITDKIEATPRLFIWDYWDSVKNAFSPEGIVWWTYTVFVLLVAAVIVVMLSRRYAIRRRALWAAAATLVVFVISCTILLARLSDYRRDTDAVVLAAVITVKNSPDERSTDAFVLHAGVKVQMVDHVGTWTKVRLADGKVGWMPRSAMEVI